MLDSTSPASLISTHTPLARRDGNFGQPAEMYGFLLTRLLRGVTRRLNFLLLLENISTHTPLARRDNISPRTGSMLNGFLLTRLLRGVTFASLFPNIPAKISTHTPLARRDSFRWFYSLCLIISTHTPLARRDLFCIGPVRRWNISTHTPLARRDYFFLFGVLGLGNFYSHASCEA